MRSRGSARAAYAALSAGTIGAGLVWRLAPLGLPPFLLKYGGSVLWGAMAYFVVAALAPGARMRATIVAAGLASAAVEFLRLYHAPWLDDFRRTFPGTLLLGRIFSPWDIFAYWIGIGLGGLADRLLIRSRIVGTGLSTDPLATGPDGGARPVERFGSNP